VADAKDIKAVAARLMQVDPVAESMRFGTAACEVLASGQFRLFSGGEVQTLAFSKAQLSQALTLAYEAGRTSQGAA